MAQITYSDPLRQRKRVHYTGSDTLYEGEPLCYSVKTTRNWYGYSDSAGAIGDTTAEGSHNEGKYIYVESPMRASTSVATFTSATKLLTDDGAEFDNLQVGMFVSVASPSDDTDIDGIYEITAQSATNNTITLGNMTDAVAATVTTGIDDVTVKIDNIAHFAGVVASGGWVGKAGPCELDIYIPNGAVVPVRNDQNCVLGRTILAVHTNEQHLTAPHASDARPVAIAWETVDTATTTGLCLAKLDPNIFIHQMGDNGGLIVDDEDTSSSMAINKMEITFNSSSLYHRPLYYIANLAGGGAGLNGVFKFRTYVSSTMTSLVQGVCSNLHVQQGGNLITGSGEFNSCFYATVETESITSGGFASTTCVCAYQAVYYVDEANCTAPGLSYVLGIPAGYSAGTYNWNGLLYCGEGGIGDYATESGGVSASATNDRVIPIRIGLTTYYLLAYVDDGID